MSPRDSDTRARNGRAIQERGREQSQRDCVLQPKVARNELPWVTFRNPTQPQRGCGKFLEVDDLIPHVFLIPFDLMLAQQRAQLILKTHLTMMLS